MKFSPSTVHAITDGYECLLPSFVQRKVSALDVINACDVLLNAGFTLEAICVLEHVLVGNKNINEKYHGGRTSAQQRYDASAIVRKIDAINVVDQQR